MMTFAIHSNWDSLILHRVNPTGKEIGRGAYGRVFEVDYEGTLCAAKEVHELLLQYAQGDEFKKIKDGFLNECKIWSTLRHPCVVQFLGVYHPAIDQYQLPIMVMEKMQHSLRGLVEKYDNIPLNVKLSILDEVCLGLRYLHSRNPPIVHRDLTPNNILLSNYLEAKITDLGVAKFMEITDTRTMTKAPGTTDFMPPECLANRPVYGLPLDIFSFGGVVLYTITQLWPQPSSWVSIDHDTGRKVYLSETQRRQHLLDKMTEDIADLKSLVISCLDDDPKSRPLVAQVSMTIKRLKYWCSQKSSRDGMSSIVWWVEVSSEQQSCQQVSSLAAGQEVVTLGIEQLRIENDNLKSNNDTLKDTNKQLTTLLNKMAANNEDQIQQINSLHSEIASLRTEAQKLTQQLILMESCTADDLFSGPVNIKWEKGAPEPVGRYGHTAVWLNGLVYVGGGYEAGSKESYTISCYDPVKNSWASPIDVLCCFFALTTLNGDLLMVGGQGKYSKKTNQILIIGSGQLRYYTKMITARSSAVAAGYQGILIITGGEDDKGKKLSSTELFDSNIMQWYICSDLPQPHSVLQSVIVDNILYLLGGFNKAGHGSQAVFAASLDTLSKHQLKWNTPQDTPWCRSAPVSINNKQLLVVGGGNKILSRYTYASDVLKLNRVSHTWEVVGQIPEARRSPAAVGISDNKLIVIGGRNDNNRYINAIWIGSCKPQ